MSGRTAGDEHSFMMFSATFPKAARELAQEHMALDHVRIRVGRVGSTHANIMQRVRTPFVSFHAPQPRYHVRRLRFMANKLTRSFG